MSSRCREKYPRKVAGTFIEPTGRTQETGGSIPNSHQDGLCRSLKIPRQKWRPLRELDSIISVPSLFRSWGSCLCLSLPWGLVGGLGQRGPRRLLSVPGTEGCFAEGTTVCPQCRDCFSSASSRFIFNRRYGDLCCLPASERGQRGRAQAISEHGSRLPGVSH